MNRGSPPVTISANEARRAKKRRKNKKNLGEPPAGSLRDLLFARSADYTCRPTMPAPPTDTDATAGFHVGYRRLRNGRSNGAEIRAEPVINLYV